MTVPVFAERWANRVAPVTVPAGADGTAGTQTWQITGGFTDPVTGLPLTWTAASGTIMRLYDPAMPLEIVRATALTAAGALTVVRGDQFTTVTAHRPGFELAPCISAGGLAARAHGVPSGQGLVIPEVSPTNEWTDAAQVEVAGINVPGGEGARPGSCYELMAFGYVRSGNASHQFEVAQYWGGIGNPVGYHFDWTVPAAANVRWRVHAQVTTHNTGNSFLSGSLLVLLANSPDQTVPVRRFQIGPASSTGPAGINLANPARYYLTVRLRNAEGPGFSFTTVQGGRGWRSA